MKKLAKIGLPVAAVLLSAASNAAIIPSWDYSTEASFTGATYSSGGGTTVTSVSELSWGETGGFFSVPSGTANNPTISDGERSALTIGQAGISTTGGGAATGTGVETIIGFGGFPVPAANFGLGISFTHWNNPITSGFQTLTSGTIVDTLQLTPTVGGSGPVDAEDITFEFNFVETSNGGACLIVTSPTPCNDIFAFEDPAAGLNTPFSYEGENYFAHVLLLNETLDGAAPITPLGASVCSALGLTPACLGFSTQEGQATTINFGFAVSTSPAQVPLPSTLALFGLGLLGLGYRAKRKAA